MNKNINKNMNKNTEMVALPDDVWGVVKRVYDRLEIYLAQKVARKFKVTIYYGWREKRKRLLLEV